MNLSGIIIIDKPEQWTSHDVVAKLRGALRQGGNAKSNAQGGKLRVGHGGTLDPMATGVLPIFVGRATRVAEFAEKAEKEYVAGIRFGLVTDTQDITGNVLETKDVTVAVNELKEALPRFTGAVKQVPPMYSAIKKDGKKLYELARKGIEVERPPREIEIFEIEIASLPVIAGDAPSDFYIRVSCSKGTYIRTLCHDIGQALGCGAAMSYLRRTKAGVFTIEDAHTLDAVIAGLTRNPLNYADFIIPIDRIFSNYKSICLSDADSSIARNGALRHIRDYKDGRYRFYASGGEFLFFGEVSKGQVKIIKSFFGA